MKFKKQKEQMTEQNSEGSLVSYSLIAWFGIMIGFNSPIGLSTLN